MLFCHRNGYRSGENCRQLRAFTSRKGSRLPDGRLQTGGLWQRKDPKGLRNSDALALQRNSSLQLDYATVNPYTFAEPTSPHIISAQEGRPIEALVMSAGLRALEQQADWVLVEGAGGWFTPLSDTFTFADWVTQEQLPVILVVGVKLGCINHAMLTAQAILHAGLTLAGWVANDVTPPENVTLNI